MKNSGNSPALRLRIMFRFGYRIGVRVTRSQPDFEGAIAESERHRYGRDVAAGDSTVFEAVFGNFALSEEERAALPYPAVTLEAVARIEFFDVFGHRIVKDQLSSAPAPGANRSVVFNQVPELLFLRREQRAAQQEQQEQP